MGIASDISKMHITSLFHPSSGKTVSWQCLMGDAHLLGDGQASTTFVDRQEEGLEERLMWESRMIPE